MGEIVPIDFDERVWARCSNAESSDEFTVCYRLSKEIQAVDRNKRAEQLEYLLKKCAASIALAEQIDCRKDCGLQKFDEAIPELQAQITNSLE